MRAIVCACGRRIEDGDWATTSGLMFALRTPTHDPDECSRNVGMSGNRMRELEARVDALEAQALRCPECGRVGAHLGTCSRSVMRSALDSVVVNRDKIACGYCTKTIPYIGAVHDCTRPPT